MTTFSETLSWQGNASLDVQESAPDWINRRYPPQETESISFDFSPHGLAKIYLIGASSYDAGYKMEVDTPITFTATAVFPPEIYAIEYYWDFGDGTEGWGSPITHTFSYQSQRLRVTLRVTDNKGKRYYVGKQHYIEQAQVGIAIETDTALPASAVRVISVGLASETDTALTATVS